MKALICAVISVLILLGSVQTQSVCALQNRSNKVREMIEAAANGDAKRVFEILNSRVNVNATFARDDSALSGMTALMVASSHGYSNLVEQLIKRGADVNLKRYTGETPLMFAADSGDVKTVRALLRARANPNATLMSTHAGEMTPLIRTINSESQHRLEVAKILIDAKAEINPR